MSARALTFGMGAAAAVASLVSAPGLAGIAGAGLSFTALDIAWNDIRRRRIPDGLSAVAAGFGLLDIGAMGSAPALLWALARALAMAALFLSVRGGYRALRGREGLGLGDVKLAAVAGIWLDGVWLPLSVGIAATAGLSLVLLRRLRSGRPIDRFEKMPFGALFAPSIWICWWMALFFG